MKNFLQICLSLALLTAGIPAVAQVTVRGTVTDETGQTVVAAGVVEAGTTNGAVTDARGQYVLTVKGPDSVLEFSCVGYETQRIPAGRNGVIDVVLKESATFLEETVVIGYGTQRKGDVTSAVTSVKAEDFNAGQMLDAGDLIQGKVAGLTIANGSGDPSSTSTIRLRGVISMEGSQTPLVLVDGIEGSLSTVAPESIESIDVLKDASAAAIYGTRGANGVILITTKNGRRDDNVTVTYSGYASLSNFAKTLRFMNVADIRAGHTDLEDKGHETNWLKEISRTAFSHNHNVNISGGLKNTSFYADFTYRDTEGTIIDTYRKSLNLNAGVSQWLFNDILKVGLDIQSRQTVSDIVSSSSAYHQAILRNPTEPVYNEDGTFYENFSATNYYNPVAYIKAREGNTRNHQTRLTGNITLEPVKGWQTNLKLALVNGNSVTDTFRNQYDYQNINYGYTGQATLSHGGSQQKLMEITSKYDLNTGKHRFNALAGYSWQYDDYKSFSAYNREFPSYFFGTNNLGLGRALKEGNATMSSYREDSKLIGFFGRISYGYDNRYNILVSIRHEGSSKFGKNYQWGNFPSVSAGWNIHNEDFMRNVSWVDELKLRAGWGITGVIPNDSYMSLTRYDYDGYYYSNGEWLPGMSIASNPNTDLRWERSQEVNVGLDAQFLNRRVGFSVDVYKKTTSDMLYWYNVPTPPYLYDRILANVGKMTNKGIEVALNLVPVRTRDFQWNADLTFSHNVNRLESLSNDFYETDNYQYNGGFGNYSSAVTHRLEPGQRVDLWYGPKAVGISENGLWLIENVETGEAEEYFVKMDNNDTYRQVLGHALPDLYFGMNHSFRYKGFDLNLQFTGQFGFQILNENRVEYESYYYTQYNHLASLLNAPFADGNTLSRNMNSKQWTSAHLEKGDFLKLKNASAGYTFNFGDSAYISSARLYVAGTNLFTITKYSGLDPELSNADMWYFGHESSTKYPPVRTLTVGVNLKFGKGGHRRPAQTALEPRVVERIVEKVVEKEVVKEVPVEVVKEVKVPVTAAFDGTYEDDLYFLLGKSELRPEEAFKLGRIAQILSENPDATITVTGYADSATGNSDINQNLSEQRAHAVVEMLRNAGISPNRIGIRAAGSDRDASKSPESNRVAVCIVK